MPAFTVPEGKRVPLDRRGATWVRDLPGPSPASPTVILLHGLGATGALNWFPSFRPLNRTHRVVSVDHRGHGRGIRSRGPFRLEDCADDVAALVEMLDVGPVVLAGYSMGGPITQLTWRRHPEVVRGVVLCATSHRFGRGDARLAVVGSTVGLGLRFTPRLVRQQIVRGTIGLSPRARGVPDWVTEELGYHDPAALVEAGVAISRFDSTDWIGDIDVPAASVITTLDRLVPPRRQETLAELTRAKVFRVAGGHDVCVRQPGVFVPALVNAVATVTR